MRNLYASSGLSVRPKERMTKIQQLKLMIEAWGMDPNEVLSKEALMKPYRTIVDPEQYQIEILNQTLKQAIIKDLQIK